jgi:SAM-dependent methyltransferase
MNRRAIPAARVGRLGDTTSRNYSRKLRLFNALARRELRELIASLDLTPGMLVLDAGCGTGEALHWLLERVLPGGRVTGIDLAEAHVAAARERPHPCIEVHAGDLSTASFPPGSFDLIWCVNTLHHLEDPLGGLRRLSSWLRPGGRVVLGQSAFLPDMYFAWDAGLEARVNDAVRRYYRDRYGLGERDIGSVRALVGLMREAGMHRVAARTVLIERISPLDPHALAYLREAVFLETWGDRLLPYLGPDDSEELARLTDPRHPRYAPRRTDFHYLQTFTLVTAEI